MEKQRILAVLRSLKQGDLDPEEALRELRFLPFEDLGFARVELAGTWRGKLLASGEIEPRRIRVDEVSAGDEVLLFNSVRGVYRGVLVGKV